jgi:hypothetical protein
MAKVFRLAGAIVASTNDDYFLVGNTKAPCDWTAAGFERPVEIDATKHPYVRLSRAGEVTMAPPILTMDIEGEELARCLAQRFIIERNGSVSDRLWRLVVSPDDPLEEREVPTSIDARWLGQIPSAIWSVVKSTVLRCV